MKRFLLIILLVVSMTGCTLKTKEPISKSGIFFDTVISINIFDSSDQDLLNHCFDLCKKYEDIFSRTIPTSDISRINAANGASVTVSEEAVELLQKGLYYSELSGGAFDITIAPLSELWNFKQNSKTIPDQALIDQRKTHVNYQTVSINGNTVTLKDAQAQIDLGAIAKGYIADRLKEYLVAQGVEHALIDLGGNVLTIGSKVNGTPYNIGIQRPFGKQNDPITSVSVEDMSVVSSGIYERYFELDDKIYHHILNPATGYPYENNLLEVSIISKESVDGDGLSTTCFALGLDKGLALINSLEDTEAIFITDDYQLHYSDNLSPQD